MKERQERIARTYFINKVPQSTEDKKQESILITQRITICLSQLFQFAIQTYATRELFNEFTKHGKIPLFYVILIC